MARQRFLVVVLLACTLAACATTSTVHQPLALAADPDRTYLVSFGTHAGGDTAGMAKLERVILRRLHEAGLLVNGATTGPRIEVAVTHYYLRSDVARHVAGILAGRDRIASRVLVFDGSGAQVGSFDVETTNHSAWGTGDGLMQRHADEIVARLGP